MRLFPGLTAWLGGLPLDLKLGGRMLVKFPGLTLVGGLAMAFAICFGVITFQMVTMLFYPKLPMPEADRIVQFRLWDASASIEDSRMLHEFVSWRGSLSTVMELGAYRDLSVNLVIGEDAREVTVAEITPTAFRLDPTPPLLGRVLGEGDEAAGAAPVVVLGYDVWKQRFASDAGVIGRSVRLGDGFATVVGVMPDGFAFPIAHEAWMPLRPAMLDQAPRAGPGINIFGKLAPGATLEGAQAELTALGARAAAEFPDTHKHLLPQVAPYAKGFVGNTDFGFFLAIPTFAVMLLVLICGNVALLLFARTATRQSELAVRSALGASRGRIVAQIFAEALVLGGVAAAVGLGAAAFILEQWGLEFLKINYGMLPFWFDLTVRPMTILYAVGLTVLSAVIVGVLPALKVTRAFNMTLKASAAGSGGLRFSGVWTAIIIAQVAATVAFPALVMLVQREISRVNSHDVGFRTSEYLTLKLDLEDPSVARFVATLETLRQRVGADVNVRGVTYVDHLPLMNHPIYRIELDEPAGAAVAPVPSPGATADGPRRWANFGHIDPSYFAVLETPLVGGRAFHAGDVAAAVPPAIVDQGFVAEVLQGRNPIGRRVRIRELAPDGTQVETPWHEIVGVAKELGMGDIVQPVRASGLYLPVAPGRNGAINMMIHARGDPAALQQMVRSHAVAVDPSLRVSDVKPMDAVTDDILWILRLWQRISGVLTALALLLSLAGIYAVLSFIVTRRTREIGVRVALGASRRRVVTAIFKRPLTQVTLGVLVGGALIFAGGILVPQTEQFKYDPTMQGFGAGEVALLVAYAVFMLGVCLLACVVPTRRALGVQPSEALRAE
jgi:putative ABC transport system permease protein